MPFSFAGWVWVLQAKHTVISSSKLRYTIPPDVFIFSFIHRVRKKCQIYHQCLFLRKRFLGRFSQVWIWKPLMWWQWLLSTIFVKDRQGNVWEKFHIPTECGSGSVQRFSENTQLATFNLSPGTFMWWKLKEAMSFEQASKFKVKAHTTGRSTFAAWLLW